MSENPPVWAPSRTYTPMATVEAQLDETFAAARLHGCRDCGAIVVAPTEDVCYPCRAQNRRGPIYGGSLAGHPPVPGDALRAVEAVWLTPVNACRACAAAQERIDVLLDQNDAQAIENSDLARQVVSLKGHLEQLSAQVRQGKGNPSA